MVLCCKMQAAYGRVGLGLHFQSRFSNLVRKEHILLRKLWTCRLASAGNDRSSVLQSRSSQWAWLPGMRSCDCRMSSGSRTGSDVEELADSRMGEISSGEKDRGSDERKSGGGMPLSSLVEDEAVEFDKLTADEKEIYRLHKGACQAGQSSYIDPSTGYIVLTQSEHIDRGKCCGNCCRHCPYGHANVPVEYRTKKFNSAFFV
ncbi:uncharacterized protein LOC119720228 [Patiria miniata]|uniref:Uncharacterized protein n=1 Tax=Patiria miniata TaxID=46514 RepID=A0A913Z246_PATMI|nr:uncharacterized protein LOC119720228 [Patiria miniata]